ncbi:MAG: acylphosphatase [Candidatus Lokiarchaeota archaeon]|nr:acylphosphatase [Candidatus Harpocratesius repetitus]
MPTKPTVKILKAQVFGRVQGVWFRGSTRDYARRLNLTGWVKNEPDGTVRVYAEGSESEIKNLLEYIHHGPKYAQVINVKYSIEDNIRKYHTFSITF